MSAGDRDTLAQLLDAHSPLGGCCKCGYRIENKAMGTIVPQVGSSVVYTSLTASQHRAHVADVIASSDWLEHVKEAEYARGNADAYWEQKNHPRQRNRSRGDTDG